MNTSQYRGFVIFIAILFVVIIGEIVFYSHISKGRLSAVKNTIRATTPTTTPKIEKASTWDSRTGAINIVTQIYDTTPTSALITAKYSGTIYSISSYTDQNYKEGKKIILQAKTKDYIHITLTSDDVTALTLKNSEGKDIDLSSLKARQAVEINIVSDLMSGKDVSTEILIVNKS